MFKMPKLSDMPWTGKKGGTVAKRVIFAFLLVWKGQRKAQVSWFTMYEKVKKAGSSSCVRFGLSWSIFRTLTPKVSDHLSFVETCSKATTLIPTTTIVAKISNQVLAWNEKKITFNRVRFLVQLACLPKLSCLLFLQSSSQNASEWSLFVHSCFLFVHPAPFDRIFSVRTWCENKRLASFVQKIFWTREDFEKKTPSGDDFFSSLPETALDCKTIEGGWTTPSSLPQSPRRSCAKLQSPTKEQEKLY